MLSRSNSEHRFETGGILGGIKEKGLFKTTHQNGSHDRWEVNDVRQISNFFSYNDLILLGLIHTHPAMSSFLSSVDLHALWDYARNNKSLISIVLAPEKKTAPAFCLTNVGLEKLKKCKDKDFHRHQNDQSYYKVASHTRFVDSNIIVHDFRFNK